MRKKYRFIHVAGNADMEARLADLRASSAATSPHAAAAIDSAEAKRRRRRERNLKNMRTK